MAASFSFKSCQKTSLDNKVKKIFLWNWFLKHFKTSSKVSKYYRKSVELLTGITDNDFLYKYLDDRQQFVEAIYFLGQNSRQRIQTALIIRLKVIRNNMNKMHTRLLIIIYLNGSEFEIFT